MGDVVQIRTVDHNFYTTGIEFREYEEDTEPCQLNMLKEADFEYLLTQSFSCLSESSAKTFLTHQEKSLQETRDRAQSQLAQLGTRARYADVQRVRDGLPSWNRACLG